MFPQNYKFKGKSMQNGEIQRRNLKFSSHLNSAQSSLAMVIKLRGVSLKGVPAKNERGYRLNAKNMRF